MKLAAALFCALFLVGLPSARAAEKKILSYCKPARQLDRVVEDCDQNNLYIEAGEKCLAKLEKAVDRVTAQTQGLFSPNAGQKQTAQFESSFQDYAAASAGLARMIALTEAAISDTKEYLESIVEPEDADEEEVNGGDKEAYLEMAPCFGETRKSLQSLLKDFQDIQTELVVAKQAADAHAGTSAAREDRMENGAAAPGKILRGKAQGGAKAGNSPRPKSDITGVDQELQRLRKKR